MSAVARVGIALGKHSFPLHGQDKSGREVFRKKATPLQMMRFLGNRPNCTGVMEVGAGSHFVARQLKALGHEVKRLSPPFVRPFVKDNKNDFIDAEAIGEPRCAS